MAIGTTINYSIPVVGTTVSSTTKAREGLYSSTATVGGSSYNHEVRLRPAGVSGTTRRFGLTYKISPATAVGSSTAPLGSVSVSINIDSVIGTAVTTSVLADQIRYALSSMLSSTLVETLRDGSLQ
jgi:hypothetical protein